MLSTQIAIAPRFESRERHMPAAPSSHFNLSEVIAALSYALDITEGQPEGHALRTCVIGLRIADVIGLPRDQRQALFYALLLKDLGCSSNAARICTLLGADDLNAKLDVKLIDWTSLPASAQWGIRHAAPGRGMIEKALQIVRAGLQGGPFAANEIFAVRCERGATIAQFIGMPQATAEAIQAIDEHWDGHGLPAKLSGEAIPLLARICCIAQTFDIFHTAYGMEAAWHVIHERCGRWFDPALVDALEQFRADGMFWRDLPQVALDQVVTQFDPHSHMHPLSEAQIDMIAEGFAQIIDAKSPWTYRHSTGVAELAVGIGAALGLAPSAQRQLRRAALLHDIGKLGIPNIILDKPGSLTSAEFARMREHTAHTQRILGRVSAFRDLAEIAAAHHERLDGSGYHRGLHADQLSPLARILAAADVGDALAADRPYRTGMQRAAIMQIMEREAGTKLWPPAVEALDTVLAQREA